MYKRAFNLPPLVLKVRHLSSSTFCWVNIGLPEQALGWFPLGLGLVMEDRPTELSCMLFSLFSLGIRVMPTQCSRLCSTVSHFVKKFSPTLPLPLLLLRVRRVESVGVATQRHCSLS